MASFTARVGETTSPFPRPTFYIDPDGRLGLAALPCPAEQPEPDDAA